MTTLPTQQPTIAYQATRLFKLASLSLIAIGGLYLATQWLPNVCIVAALVALLTTLFGFLLDGLEASLTRIAKLAPSRLFNWLQQYQTLRRGIALSLLLIGTVLFLSLGALVWLPFWGKQFKSLANSLPQYVQQIHGGWQHLSQRIERHPILAPLHLTVTSSLKELQAEGPAANDDVLGETVVAIATTPTDDTNTVTISTTPSSNAKPTPSATAKKTPITTSTTPTSPGAIDTTPLDNLPYPPGFFQRILLNSFQQVASFVTASFSSLIYGLVALVIVVFCLMEPKLVPRFISQYLPTPWQPASQVGWQAAQSLMAYTVIGQIITAGLSGLALFGLYSMLGVDYPGILSLLFALCTLVPAVGAWFGAIPNCIVVLATGHGQGLIAVAAALLLIYAIKTALWKPARVVEGITLPLKLNPLLLVISFVVCWHWLGPVGVVAVTPLAVLISSGITLWKYRLTHG